MKKIIFVTLTLVFAAAGLSAQSASGGFNISTGQQPVSSEVEASAKDATDKLNNVVSLSSDQYTQVMQVNRRYFSSPQSHNPGPGRGAARQGFNREQQLKSILTSDQWQVYENAKAQGQTF